MVCLRHNANSLCKHDEEKHSLMDAIHMSKHRRSDFIFIIDHFNPNMGTLDWKLMDFDFLHSFEWTREVSLLLHLLIFINVGSRFSIDSSKEMYVKVFVCSTKILVIMLSDFNNFPHRTDITISASQSLIFLLNFSRNFPTLTKTLLRCDSLRVFSSYFFNVP